MKTPILSATMTLVDVMSLEERAALAAHLTGYNVALLPRGNSLTRFVGALFVPGARLSVSAICKAAEQAHPEATRKQIYNVLGYLTRRRVIRGVYQGVYEATRAAGAA